MKLLHLCGIVAALCTTSIAAPKPQSPAAPTIFSDSIQTQIQTLEGYIQNVIKVFAQGQADEQTLITTYSSTGRSLAFFLYNDFLPQGPTTCPQALAGISLPPQANNTDQAIAYMQQAQLALIAVSQDAIQNNFQQGIYDACEAVRHYGGAAMDY